MKALKRLLAVSWELPPMYGPRATQVARTLGQLASLGWHSTVVCLDPRPGGPHWRGGAGVPFPTFPQGVDVVRVPSPEEWTIVRAAWRLLPALRDRPDSKWVWIGRAMRAATHAAATTTFDGLVTFGQPWSDHLVGLRVHRVTKLRWVAHFSDPWADSPYLQPAHRREARRMEEEVVREAGGLVFVTSQMADLVMKKYPQAWREKVGVVPHGFDATRVQTRNQGRDRRHGGRMRLVYTGRFYEGLRTPTAVLQALSRINARQSLADVVEVTFVGPHVTSFARDAARLGLDAFVEFRDRVPPDEAAAIASAADALLVIDAPTEGPSPFLPSKLVEYLPLRKPIFGVTPATGATAELLERLGCGMAPPDDIDAIETALICLLRKWREGSLLVSPEFDRVAGEFDICRTTAQLAGMLTRAFDRAG